MKKLLLIQILLVVSCAVGFAQASLYKKAIKKGPNSYGLYRIDNSKKTGVSLESMQKYLIKEGYVVGNYTWEQAKVFGDAMIIVKEMDFFKAKDVPAYVFACLKETNVNPDQLKGNGTAFLATRREVLRKEWLDRNKLFAGEWVNEIFYERIDNIQWTGTIKDGFINGKGGGICKKGKDYVCIEGSFSNGLPMEDCVVKRIEINGGNYAIIDGLKIQRSQTLPVDLSAILEKDNQKDPIFAQAVNLQRFSWYHEGVEQIKSIQQYVLGLDYDKSTINDEYKKIVNSFIGAYNKYNYDPENIMPIAEEYQGIFNMFDCKNLMNNPYVSGYYDHTSDYRDEWGQKNRNAIAEAERKINNALNAVKIGKRNSKYFKNLYAQAEGDLIKIKEKFEKKISDDFERYKRDKERRAAERAEYEARYSKQIDSESSKSPSGKIVDKSFIFGTHWVHEKDGEIRFKAGSEYVRYEIVYRNSSGTEIYGYNINYATPKIREKLKRNDYKTFAELVNAISNAVQ